MPENMQTTSHAATRPLPHEQATQAANLLVTSMSVFALFFSITNFVPLSAIVILALPLIWLGRQKAPDFVIPLWIYTLSVILFTLVYNPESFLNFEFYRRDGNYFVSFAPLLIIPFFKSSINFERVLRIWLSWALIIYLGDYLYWITLKSGDTFGGLFVARNAVGGFLAQVACLAYALARLRNRFYTIHFIVLVAILISTYSRGSALGLFIAVALSEWHLRIENATLRRLPVYIAFSFLFGLTFYLGYSNIGIYKQSFGRNDSYFAEADDVKAANVYVRLYQVWPRAVDAFMQSPILGIGFGAFDDLPIDAPPLMPGVALNQNENIQHSDAHAHNTYLHVLAEQGIFGLMLLLAMLVKIYWYVDRQIQAKKTMQGKALPSSLFLFACFFSLVIASFTEHRLFTPSNALPFTIALGLSLSSRRTIKGASTNSRVGIVSPPVAAHSA